MLLLVVAEGRGGGSWGRAMRGARNVDAQQGEVDALASSAVGHDFKVAVCRSVRIPREKKKAGWFTKGKANMCPVVGRQTV